jgi:hypothetical protein
VSDSLNLLSFSFWSTKNILTLSLIAVMIAGSAVAIILVPAQSVYAQQQAPESDKSKGQGQGPPFNRGICITTGNLNPTVEPKSEQAKEVCDQAGQVSNQGQCMQILREAEEQGEPSPFGSVLDTNEECKEAFPYTAPNSQNPND